MKRRIILFILPVLYFGIAYSQITSDPIKRIIAIKHLMINQVRVILSAKATIIRKDAVLLKLQPRQFQDSVTMLKKDIDNAADQSKNKLNSLSEMEKTESLRLQMSMDRMSKMMSTLSNLLKKNQRNITVNYPEFKMNPGL
jgi:hypothetical protein